MEQFIRTNDDGKQIIDYDLLNMSARINFARYIELWSSEIVEDELENPSLNRDEKVSAVHARVEQEIENAWMGDAAIEPETRLWLFGRLVTEIIRRYNI